MRCIVYDDGDTSVTLYFTEGPTHSMMALRNTISRYRLTVPFNPRQIEQPFSLEKNLLTKLFQGLLSKFSLRF